MLCISRLCYDVSVRLSVCLSVRLSVTEVHCGHGACREEGRGESYFSLRFTETFLQHVLLIYVTVCQIRLWMLTLLMHLKAGFQRNASKIPA